MFILNIYLFIIFLIVQWIILASTFLSIVYRCQLTRCSNSSHKMEFLCWSNFSTKISNIYFSLRVFSLTLGFRNFTTSSLKVCFLIKTCIIRSFSLGIEYFVHFRVMFVSLLVSLINLPRL